MKNHSHSSSHLTKTGGGKGKRTFCKKTLVLAVSSALVVIASPSLLNAQSVSGPASNSVIQWQATTTDGDRTIHIQYPDGTRYYQYNYTGTPSFTGRQDSLTGNVSGDFKGSDFTNADPNATGAKGGALVNTDSLGTVSGNFLENTVHYDQWGQYAQGGALHNEGNINSLSGQFVANQADGGTSGIGAGAAVSNKKQIGSLNSDFIGNFGTGYETRGGALFNDTDGNIGKISGNFISNISGGSYYNWGGAIYNLGTVGDINANFIGNMAALDSETDGSASAIGGAIYNKGAINSISGNVHANHAFAYSASGGAFYNDVGGTIHSVSGKFDGNYASSVSSTYGGVIANYGNIDRITGDFTNNYAKAEEATANTVYGGVIANLGTGTIGSISGNFIRNTAQSTYKAFGGVLYSSFEGITSVSGNFHNNSAISTGSASMGGAIYTSANIANISGNFTGNKAEASGATTSSYARGGAIYLMTTRTSIRESDKWGQLEHAKDQHVTNSLFQDNVASSTNGKASGGAINNYVTYNANDRYVGATQPQVSFEESRLLEEFRLKVTNSSFIDNKANGVTAQGGAICSNNHMEVVADNGVSVFKGNTANGQSSAIYIAKKTGDAFKDIIKSTRSIGGGGTYPDELVNPPPPNKLYLTARNNGTIAIYDDIDGDLGKDGAPGYKLIFGGDHTGSSNISGKIHNADIYSGETAGVDGSNHIANIANAGVLSDMNNNLTVNSGDFNIRNLDFDNLKLNKLTLTAGNLNVNNVKVDLVNNTMGTISATEYVTGNTVINVQSFSPTIDTVGLTTTVHFVDPQIAGQVVNQSPYTYAPIYRYKVGYDPTPGDFTFVRPANPGGEDFNPEVTVPGIANVLLAAMLNDEIYSRVLSDADTYKTVPAQKNADTWVKAFGSRDNVHMKNDYHVNANFSGIIGGVSSGKIEGEDNWSRVFNAYAAYAHGEQNINRGTIRQDIAYLGGSVFTYKGDFFAGLTGNVAIAHNKTSESLGHDTFNSYLAGFGLKTGYDLRLNDNVTFQPNLYASFTHIKSDDYTSKSNVNVKFGNMNVYEIAPGFKLFKEYDNKVKGYIQTRYVWTNTSSSQNVVLNDSIVMPDAGIKPYVEYGIGLEKNTPHDKYSGYFQILRRDGGRSGWNAIIGGKMKF